MSNARPATTFLVSAIGAYEDSGLGTGGFVSVTDGEAHIIDKMDSTGLCERDGEVYRFIRALGTVVGYRDGGCHYQLRMPGVRDVHDIIWHRGELVCVATGSNEVLWLDPLGRITRRWQCKGTRDAWHLNCVWEVDGKLYATAFGRFDEHRGWVGKCTEKGFVVEVGTEHDVVTGLSGPHNPRWVDGQWMICDSHANGLFVQRPGESPRQIYLGGFTRGFAFDQHFLYVGVSADRKALTPAMESHVAILDRRSLEEVQRIRIPFPEIYDVLLAPPDLCHEMASAPEKFQVASVDDRCRALEAQVELSWKEINSLQRRLEPLLTIEEWRGRLVDWKRRVIG